MLAHNHICEVFDDFSQTLNQSGLIEISFGAAGTSVFNKAMYFKNVSTDQLLKFADHHENVGFLNGIGSEGLSTVFQSENKEFRLGQVTQRKARQELIPFRNILGFDLDFQDSIPGFLDLPVREREATALEKFKEYHPLIKRKIGNIWIINYTGNGLHFHFKLKIPLDCSDAVRYSRNYLYFIDFLEKEVFPPGVTLDRQCQNPARLFRLPFSINWKNKDAPIKGQVFHFVPMADSSHVIHEIWELADIFYMNQTK